jgi:hypothetical protein
MLQTNQVLSFFRPREGGGDWNQRELAEFYRVENALVSSGVAITTDRGVTDEGEPWFVFCREDNDEVIVHFARIDGEYVVVSNLTEGVVRGKNFNTLVRELLDSHPYVLPRTDSRRQTVYLHPATLLAALIVTGYIKSTELNNGPDESGRGDQKASGWFFNRHDLVAYTAIVIATVWDHLTADSNLHKFNVLAWFDDAKADPDTAGASVSADHAYDKLHLDDLAFNGPLDHIFDASHLATAAALGLEQQTADASGSDGWAATLTAQVKGLASLGLSTHSTNSDLVARSDDASRAENDGNSKSIGWHSDADSTELAASNVQLEQVVAANKSGPSSAQPSASASTDLHGSSISPTAVQDVTSHDEAVAFIAVSDALHIDSQLLHPVVLTATNLTDAVQTTLLHLSEASSSASPLADPLTSSATPATENAVQSLADLAFSAPVTSFDAAAAIALQQFFKETPDYKVETFGNGHDVLIVDTNVSHFPYSHLETWATSDGSTISILGLAVHTPAALQAAA